MNVLSHEKTEAHKPGDYRSDLKPIWCKGCGNFGVLSCIHRALAQIGTPPHEVAVVSGIGCSSRLPGYCATYGFNAIHGRALPIATGVKMANPNMNVLVAGGDGDGLSIGGGHFPHAGRRNVDITYIMMDNSIYGLTKGQASPSTPWGDQTKSTPYGTPDTPLDAVTLALVYNVSFVARCSVSDIPHLEKTLVAAIEHKGFSFIHVTLPCPTFRGMDRFKEMKSKVEYLEEDFWKRDRCAALQYASRQDGVMSLGIYRKETRPTLEDSMYKIGENARSLGRKSVQDILHQFYP